jgi:hypothetical protein
MMTNSSFLSMPPYKGQNCLKEIQADNEPFQKSMLSHQSSNVLFAATVNTISTHTIKNG